MSNIIINDVTNGSSLTAAFAQELAEAYPLPRIEDYAQEFGRRFLTIFLAIEPSLQGNYLNAEAANDFKGLTAIFTKGPKRFITIVAGKVQVRRQDFPCGEMGDDMHTFATQVIANLETYTLSDRWELLHMVDAGRYDEAHGEFLRVTSQDPELRLKFTLAFLGRGSYDQFRSLVLHISPEMWDSELDILLGRSSPTASFLKRKAAADREKWGSATKDIDACLKRMNTTILKGRIKFACARASQKAQSAYWNAALWLRSIWHRAE